MASLEIQGGQGVSQKTLDSLNADIQNLQQFAKTDVKFQKALEKMLDEKAGGITFNLSFGFI